MRKKYYYFIVPYIISSYIFLNNCSTSYNKPNAQPPCNLSSSEFKKKVELGLKDYKKWDYKRLNKEASDIYNHIGRAHFKEDSTNLNIALKYLDRAIELNSSESTAYQNKYNILLSINSYEEALIAIQNVMYRNNNYAQGYMNQGIILEKIGKLDSARYKYQKAYELYNLKSMKYSKLDDHINRIMLTALLFDSETALKELEKFIAKYPDNNFFKLMKVEVLKKFDRKKFINDNLLCDSLDERSLSK